MRRRIGPGNAARSRRAALGGDEALDMDAFRRDAELGEHGPQHLDHAARAAEQHVIDAGGGHEMGEQQARLRRIEPAVEHRHVLLLLREHVEHREPVEMAVLERLDLAAEHDVCGAAIAVEQEEAALLLACQHAAQDREHRRDAGASAERDMRARLLRRESDAEPAGGRHHLDRIAPRSAMQRPRRKTARPRRASPRREAARRDLRRSNRSGGCPRPRSSRASVRYCPGANR